MEGGGVRVRMFVSACFGGLLLLLASAGFFLLG